MIKPALIAAATYFAAAMTVSAQTTTPAATPSQNAGADQAQIDQGKGVYAHNCSHCHGPNMVNGGTVAPDLRAFPNDRDRFVTTVKRGKNGRMPPWGDVLNDDQIATLWDYLASRRTP
ncbi:c-type cytochrome [Bradyrhizobium erythrophlei]|jgi:mono/diheme cytochrome c family protein|uniref:Cytochrome c, mono-and diheme variants n=1 Tax=Bradyrhizobium erythrophlei TaxID=1437360 RepID=A0A1M5I2P3_9BRAD|nr:cytochrome c [Bradyrhizobium erythrophlei]SHG22452.1 Cytochrome c, mono-and diheme variants [Bradyrhizobium erythrophlei]